ncbi:hypothetical protein BG015_004649 [Linnemannia schmuckeri]|uniref:Uncharacterized protein n=1 Tax=Linnemannia schmuckeri TaxID=64567 RepID=A0A9P5S1Z6_9FUNG|nr:hypothetical protein BG015_004649 [Linnemannia schmuckeri]
MASQYWDCDSNHYNNNFCPSMYTELDSLSFSPFTSTTTTSSSSSSDHDWTPMTSSSSINTSTAWSGYTYPIELRRSRNSSSKYFKWVRPIARPGRHSSPDDDSDIDEDGTDDSFLEAEYPVTTTMDSSAPEYGSSFVGSHVPEQHQQQQRQGLQSPKIKYFKWARPGRRHGGDDSDEEETDMDCCDDDDGVMFSGEDEYFSDVSSCTSAYPGETLARADSDEGSSEHPTSMMGYDRL